MRACADCRWFDPDPTSKVWHGCTSPRANPVDRITGHKEREFCWYQRDLIRGIVFGACGYWGRYFEPKEKTDART